LDGARRHTPSDDDDVVAREEDRDDDDPGDDDSDDDAYFLAQHPATFLDHPDAGLMGNDLADGLGLCRDVLNLHDALLRANDDLDEEDGRI
jgi:hypothetical protein